MHIFSPSPDSSLSPKPKVHDPVFVIMLVAVLLAVGSSLILRFTVGMGPKSAHASSPESLTTPDGSSYDRTPATAPPSPQPK